MAARILIIDDNRDARQILKLMLEGEGYSVDEASDGADGLQQYCKKPADIVITEMIMPRKEGIETIRELKNNFSDIKIIAMSAGGYLKPEIYLSLAEKFGVQRTFSKPLDQQKLLQAVYELLI